MKSIYTLSDEQKEVARKRSSKWYYDNYERANTYNKINARKWRLENPEKYLLQMARARAKEIGVPFNLEIEDITIPYECPVFEVPFMFGTPFAASVDRIIPKLGYVKGNIQIISRKTNVMKQDATDNELRKFGNWAINQYFS